MTQATFDEVLEAIGRLPIDEQAALVDVVRHRLADFGRRQIVDDVSAAKVQFANGESKTASVDDLVSEIES